MKVLVAFEESQAVSKAFRALGHEAYSADLKPCSGGHPEWHIQGDVFDVVGDGWDLMIAHPPCTHLAVSGAAWFEQKKADGRQQEGIELFMRITETDIPRVCIENPVCIMSTVWREPDQIIQPYYFGDEAQKTTCLWLRGLPALRHFPTDDLFDKKTHVGRGEMVVSEIGSVMPKWYADAWKLSPDDRAAVRSKTFPGIAREMASQWGGLLEQVA